MDSVSKTLYIPLYGKAMVSKKGVLLHDPTAESIWANEGFPLRGKSKSKWLSYFMGMRAAVFDDWLRERLAQYPNAAVLHLGCGLDARIARAEAPCSRWYDIDLPAVIEVRRRYYSETPQYAMLGANVKDPAFLSELPSSDHAIVVMEGLSMYLTTEELKRLFLALWGKYPHASILMDAYTDFAARASTYINPIKNVGAAIVSGLDDPHSLEANAGIRLIGRLSLTPKEKIGELSGFDRWFFNLMFAGRATDMMYRLYAYECNDAVR